MTQVFEFAAFTVHAGHEHALVDERPAMISALRKVFPGVLADWLTRRDDGSWLDVILWRSREDTEHAARHVTEVPEATDWFTHISESHGIEHLSVIWPDTQSA